MIAWLNLQLRFVLKLFSYENLFSFLELKIVDKAIEEHKKIFEKSKLTSDQMSASSPSSGKTSQSDDNSSEDEQEKEEKNSVTMQNSDEKNLPLKGETHFYFIDIYIQKEIIFWIYIIIYALIKFLNNYS